MRVSFLGATVHPDRVMRVFVRWGLGAILGGLVWLIEMSIRFGGVVSAVRDAATIGHLSGGESLTGSFMNALRLADGPPVGPDRSGNPAFGLLWWTLGATLVVIAFSSKTRRRSLPLWWATAGGVVLGATYVFGASASPPRFLLPSYALLAIPAGAGLTEVASWCRRRPIALPVLSAVCIAWMVGQIAIARGNESRQLSSTARARDIGLVVGRLAARNGCTVAASHDYPEIAFAARCGGAPIRDSASEGLRQQLLALSSGGTRVFVVTPVDQPPDVALRTKEDTLGSLVGEFDPDQPELPH
jgi:hypothetical protein